MVLSRMVGAEVRRKEDPRLITGSSTYVDDLKIAEMKKQKLRLKEEIARLSEAEA